MRLFSFLSICLLFTVTAQADVVTDWNNLLLQSIRNTNMNPPRASRAMAMTHTAIFDALNSINQQYQPYHFYSPPGQPVIAEVAAMQAARDILVNQFPTQAVTLDAALTTGLNSYPNGAAKTAAITLGSTAATSIINLRAADNANTVVPYTPGSNPGDWQPTAPAFAPALLPNWPTVTPWTMNSGSQFRNLVGPPALNSAQYANALQEVRDLGSATSMTRTADQTQIAQFWADGGGTATPPGHWNRIAQDVVTNQNLSLIDSARTFALLNLGMADAAISCWDIKYHYDFWRPITAIQTGAISPDPSWTPLITTPPFPGYSSGHSTFSGAAAEILTDLFGNSYSFSTTQDGTLTTRNYTSFLHAAQEAADSRLYGGIHFRFDNEDGTTAGQALGNYVGSSFLQPIPEPGTIIAGAIALFAVGACVRRNKKSQK
jgi:hypothetical protein